MRTQRVPNIGMWSPNFNAFGCITRATLVVVASMIFSTLDVNVAQMSPVRVTRSVPRKSSCDLCIGNQGEIPIVALRRIPLTVVAVTSVGWEAPSITSRNYGAQRTRAAKPDLHS